MQLREVREKIDLVQSVSRTTKTLELISAIKMKRLLKQTEPSKVFGKRIEDVLMGLGKIEEIRKRFPLYFQRREVKNILAVVVGSEKGFCGSYNKNILRFAKEKIDKMREKAVVKIITIGRKARIYFEKENYKIEGADVERFDFKDINRFFHSIFNSYLEGKYQKVFLFSTAYISAFLQKPVMTRILPLWKEEGRRGKIPWYKIEPKLDDSFQGVITSLIRSEFYRHILEAALSEEAERMMAMKRANENAKDILRRLILSYNRARQEKITSEVCEITAAKEATI